MITLALFFLFTLVLTIFYRYFSSGKCKYMKNVPGPKPNIFFGNTLDFAFRPFHELLDIFQNYVDTYGKIFLLHDGPLSRALIVADADFVQHILTSTKLFSKSGPYEYFYGWLGRGLLTSVGEKWKKRRRMLTPSFHFSILDNYVDVFDSVGNIFIQNLEKEIKTKCVNILELVSLVTLDITCEAAMGIKINAQSGSKSEYVKKIYVMCSIFIDRMRSPLHPFFYPLTINHLREKLALRVIHAHTDEVIEKRIKETSNNIKIEENNTDDAGKKKKLAFLDLLLNSTINGEPLTKFQIREEVDTFMFAGHDTLSSAISFALYCLAMHSEIQEKVLLEQQEIFKNFKNVKPSIAQLQKMKYLELVIKETLRLYTSVPFIGRTLTEDLEFGGNVYPKGLNVMLTLFLIHRNPAYFPDPLKFDPDRFVNAARINPYVYAPFSAGPRNCIGQKFAMLAIKSILSKVIRNFELFPSQPVTALQLAPIATLSSENGIHISFRKRN